jgi:hypothetical protein
MAGKESGGESYADWEGFCLNRETEGRRDSDDGAVQPSATPNGFSHLLHTHTRYLTHESTKKHHSRNLKTYPFDQLIHIFFCGDIIAISR